MNLEKMEVTAQLSKVQCGECGGVYAISERFRRQKQEHGGYWTCPYCKRSWGYSIGVSDLQEARNKAKNARNMLAAEKARHDQTKMTLRAHKAAKTRLKNRLANGVCPCCSHHFENLQRHIKRKHPEYNEK